MTLSYPDSYAALVASSPSMSIRWLAAFNRSCFSGNRYQPIRCVP